MAHGELVDLTIKVPAGLSGEDLENLGASFGATFPELARAAEEEGGLVVVAHPGTRTSARTVQTPLAPRYGQHTRTVAGVSAGRRQREE